MLRKDALECRFFHNDCAMVNVADNCRIVAERGFTGLCGQPLLQCVEAPYDTMEQIQHFLSSGDERFLLACKNESLLFFSQLVESTGLLLVIRFRQDVHTLTDAFQKAERGTFSLSYVIKESPNAVEQIPLEDQLSELFFYLDRILTPMAPDKLWTHCLCIANFVGCKLERASLPVVLEQPLSSGEHARLTAFLLCAFLTLRTRAGKVGIQESNATNSDQNVEKVQVIRQGISKEKEEIQTTFSLRLEQIPYRPLNMRKLPWKDEEALFGGADGFPFLALPCFGNIRFSAQSDALIFEAPFLHMQSAFHSHQASTLSFLLRFIFSVSA